MQQRMGINYGIDCIVLTFQELIFYSYFYYVKVLIGHL